MKRIIAAALALSLAAIAQPAAATHEIVTECHSTTTTTRCTTGEADHDYNWGVIAGVIGAGALSLWFAAAMFKLAEKEQAAAREQDRQEAEERNRSWETWEERRAREEREREAAPQTPGDWRPLEIAPARRSSLQPRLRFDFAPAAHNESAPGREDRVMLHLEWRW